MLASSFKLILLCGDVDLDTGFKKLSGTGSVLKSGSASITDFKALPSAVVTSPTVVLPSTCMPSSMASSVAGSEVFSSGEFLKKGQR